MKKQRMISMLLSLVMLLSLFGPTVPGAAAVEAESPAPAPEAPAAPLPESLNATEESSEPASSEPESPPSSEDPSLPEERFLDGEIVVPLTLRQPASYEITEEGQLAWFSFTATEDESYLFTSPDLWTDTVGTLYDSQGNQLAYNDDFEGHSAFGIPYDLVTGETYYLSEQFYSSRTGTVTAIVSVRHSYTVSSLQEPSCTEDGFAVYTCVYCGDTYTETVPAGHSWQTFSDLPWDIRQICSVCGQENFYQGTIIDLAFHEKKSALIENRVFFRFSVPESFSAHDFHIEEYSSHNAWFRLWTEDGICVFDDDHTSIYYHFSFTPRLSPGVFYLEVENLQPESFTSTVSITPLHNWAGRSDVLPWGEPWTCVDCGLESSIPEPQKLIPHNQLSISTAEDGLRRYAEFTPDDPGMYLFRISDDSIRAQIEYWNEDGTILYSWASNNFQLDDGSMGIVYNMNAGQQVYLSLCDDLNRALELQVSVEPLETILSGSWDDLHWSFDPGSGKLVVDGSGAIGQNNMAPWVDLASLIRSIEICGQVSKIGHQAFGLYGYYRNLEQVIITAPVRRIDNYAFSGDTSLQRVQLPDTLEELAGSVFDGDTSLVEINLPESLTLIGESTFRNTALYNDPANWTEDGLYLGNWLVEAKNNLSSLILRPGTVGVATAAVDGNRNLGQLTLPEGLRYINGAAFANCSALSQLQLPDSLERISWNAFQSCSALESVTIPGSVTEIEYFAFYGCSSLRQVELPASVTSIGSSSFGNCSSLEAFRVDSGSSSFASDARGVLYNKQMDRLIQVPSLLGPSYALEETISSLNESAFQQCSRLQNLYILNRDLDLQRFGYYYLYNGGANLTLHGYLNSSIQVFAERYGISFQLIPEEHDHVYEDGYCTVCGLPESHVPIFTDLTPGAYYNDAVDWAVTQNITLGVAPNSFAPGRACTRSQVVTFLWRSQGCPEPAGTDCPFDDVAEDAYYRKAVLWAWQKGISSGTSDTSFSPNQPCTRAQAVTFLWRAAGAPKPAATESGFQDVQANSYYERAVLWAVENEITKGTSGSSFSPNVVCSRAQVVTFLYRALAE